MKLSKAIPTAVGRRGCIPTVGDSAPTNPWESSSAKGKAQTIHAML